MNRVSEKCLAGPSRPSTCSAFASSTSSKATTLPAADVVAAAKPAWRLSRCQEGAVSLYGAKENFEFDPALGIHRQNAGDCRVGVLTADRDETARYRNKADTRINQARPDATISRHVHEIDSEVIRRRDHFFSLLIALAGRVRYRIVETPIEPGDRQLRDIGKHNREMRTVERCQQREPRLMKPAKGRKTDLPIRCKSTTRLARFENCLFERRLNRNPQDAVQIKCSLRRLVDTRRCHNSSPDHYNSVNGYSVTTNHQRLDHRSRRYRSKIVRPSWRSYLSRFDQILFEKCVTPSSDGVQGRGNRPIRLPKTKKPGPFGTGHS
jgi:hypothetical protein